MYGTIAKTVPSGDYYLFKSCVAGCLYPGIERSIRYVLDRICVGYADDPGQSSCTGTGYHIGVVPVLTNATLNARNFTRAARSGNPNIVCTCPTSYANLKECKGWLESDAGLRARAVAALGTAGLEYDGNITVSHVSEVFREKLGVLLAASAYSLIGVRAVTHHGCHYAKIYSREVASGNFERPSVLDDIVAGFGCEVLDYPERFLCCGMGFHHTLCNRDYPRAVLKRKFAGIASARPDLIITQCAGCTFNLDFYQETQLSALGCGQDIPVLYISELLALLLGADPYEVVGIDMHAVPVEPLLARLGVEVA